MGCATSQGDRPSASRLHVGLDRWACSRNRAHLDNATHYNEFYFFLQVEDGIRHLTVTGVQTCALPISTARLTRLKSLAPADLPRSDGSHLCGLYASDLSRVSLAVAFLADALQAESVSYLAAEPDARGLIVAHLERRHLSIKEDVEAGRLRLTPYPAGSAPAPLH